MMLMNAMNMEGGSPIWEFNHLTIVEVSLKTNRLNRITNEWCIEAIKEVYFMVREKLRNRTLILIVISIIQMSMNLKMDVMKYTTAK